MLKLHVDGDQVSMTPDAEMLTASATQWPVYIDPSWSAKATAGWSTISQNYPDTTYWKNTPSASGEMTIGTADGYTTRSLMNFPIDLATLTGATITRAELNVFETWSYSCTATQVDLYTTNQTLTQSNAKWSSWPSNTWTTLRDSQTKAHGWSSSCPAAGVGFDVKSAMIAAITSGRAIPTFRAARAHSETDPVLLQALHPQRQQRPGASPSPTTFPPSPPTDLHTSPTTNCGGRPGHRSRRHDLVGDRDRPRWRNPGHQALDLEERRRVQGPALRGQLHLQLLLLGNTASIGVPAASLATAAAGVSDGLLLAGLRQGRRQHRGILQRLRASPSTPPFPAPPTSRSPTRTPTRTGSPPSAPPSAWTSLPTGHQPRLLPRPDQRWRPDHRASRRI